MMIDTIISLILDGLLTLCSDLPIALVLLALIAILVL